MFRHSATTAVILGAGFSSGAKLPLQSEFSSLLLSDEFDTPIDQTISRAIREFLASAFYWKDGQPLPSLEDLFTMIDLSAATGHNLGRKLTPKLLRAIRRMLIHRVFSIIDRRFARAPEIDDFLRGLSLTQEPVNTHFISLNWDIVLERHLEYYDPEIKVDYCIQALPWMNHEVESGLTVSIAKVHGSSNWVYCDNCRALFYDRYSKLSLVIRAGLVKSDFRLFDETIHGKNFATAIGVPASQRACRLCSTAVSPHIATFSYRKSFRTHAFASSWLAAEQILTQATKWIFVGYSLPEADYEFKHLLKTAQLKFAKGKVPKKKIDVVLLNDGNAEIKYRSFFGTQYLNIFQNGLADYVHIGSSSSS